MFPKSTAKAESSTTEPPKPTKAITAQIHSITIESDNKEMIRQLVVAVQELIAEYDDKLLITGYSISYRDPRHFDEVFTEQTSE